MALTLKQALAMFWEQIQVRFVKRENGKGLSTNDFTTEEKNKLAAIQEGAEANVQSDWNENDSASQSYIVNRPFGTEVKNVTLIDNNTITVEAVGAPVQSPFELDGIIVGQAYTVTWNGTKYECIGRDPGLSSMTYLGCIGLMGVLVAEDGDEPFCVITIELGPNSYDVIVFAADVGTHSITIETMKEVIKKIDNMYLPDIIGAKGSDLSEDGSKPTAEIFNDYDSNEATGRYAHAEGSHSQASGYASHAEGNYSHASGSSSHTEGTSTSATGNYSHAEGYMTEANEESSHAEGYMAKANGMYAHAEGDNTEANGTCSHAEGSGTIANGNHSHAEGAGTEANGDWSHAEGRGTTASSTYQHTQGKYNIEDSAEVYAHIIGNGTDFDDRSNAYALDWNGNAYYAGDVYVQGDGKNDFSGAKKLATEEYVDNAAVSIDATLTIEGAAADAKAVGDAINAPKDYILLTDQVSGKKYRIYMRDGNLVSEREFDPTTDLVDFEYADNDDGTYTITSWKGTCNGQPSTEMIIPNNSAIIL